MKTIKLTQGQVALVDEEDYEYLNQWKWYAGYQRHFNSYYAYRAEKTDNGKYKTILMHRFILSIKNNLQVDHKDHNTLNNVKSNLRAATHAQNMANRKNQKRGLSSYKGVSIMRVKYKDKTHSYWRASICVNNKRFQIGNFNNEIDAAMAYNKKAIELLGEFAYLNDVSKTG